MNDTIVVFDRIRENRKLIRRESLTSLINISVNQTLSRTVMSSGLTLLTALSLLFLAAVLSGFSFALVAGIIVERILLFSLRAQSWYSARLRGFAEEVDSGSREGTGSCGGPRKAVRG